jgi:hypothetical protein
MTTYHFLDMLGGLAIFLFGMTMLNNNLTALLVPSFAAS